MNQNKKTYALIILDGWGYRADAEFNAIAAAHTPHWDFLWQNYPHTLIEGSGHAVGLPDGQMGNSEVGHLHMGAGRRVYQDLTRIDKSIQSGEFFENPVLIQAFEAAQRNNRAIHVIGLLSAGGVHSHENHLHALIKLAEQRKFQKLFIHAFLDGRDTPPKSAVKSLEYLENTCKAQIASIVGRYYAMDRDQRWDRIQKTYELLTEGKAEYVANTAQEAILAAYNRGETDEFVKPTRILNHSDEPQIIQDGDSVIFFNFRSDRARELSRALILEDFSLFNRHTKPNLTQFVTFAQYADDIPSEVAFPTQPLKNMLGDYLAQKGLRQLRLAETEKYAHVTFFFNGGVETPFEQETRILVPSPKVATYDLMPQMSAYEVTDHLVNAILNQTCDFIVCNFANPDMVGHTGDFAATVKAVEVIDDCLGKIFAALKETQSEAIITADHGNAERMFDPATQQAHTAHTSEQVPFVYIGRPARVTTQSGTLIDIAPTMLNLMGLEKPVEMEGKLLVQCLSN
jgi:2,3-bisphosphoglycerate-independent phosphoglycerate mutase